MNRQEEDLPGFLALIITMSFEDIKEFVASVRMVRDLFPVYEEYNTAVQLLGLFEKSFDILLKLTITKK